MPGIDDLYMLAGYLGCSMEYLLTGKTESLPPEAAYVSQNEAARLLIRRIMDNPPLLEALAAVASLAVSPGAENTKHA